MVEMAVAHPPAEVTDELLVIAAREGDRAAFGVLIDRYRETAYAYAASIIGNREDAEDIVQEAFVRAYVALGRFRAGGRWAGWLMRIVQNLCRDKMRRRAVRRTTELTADRPDHSPGPEQRILDIEGLNVLFGRVTKLPEKFRVPLIMRYAHQQTYKEIAIAIGAPESTVVGRLAGALRILRRQLEGIEL